MVAMALISEYCSVVVNQKYQQEKAVIQIFQENRLENCAVNCVDTIDIVMQVHVRIHCGIQ